MNLFQRVKAYFIGKAAETSRSERKRLILTFNLAIISMVVAVIYALLDIASNIYYAMPAYLGLFLIPVLSLHLIRENHTKAAKVILMIVGNLVVFWTAINDPFETGAFLLFIPTGIGSFAMLGFAENRTGILLAILTAVLFLLAYTTDISPMELPRPSETYIITSFIFNYVISLTLSVLIVYFQMDLNHASEDELMRKEIFANQKNRELEKVNEELDRFVYSVSHDLRSPLSSILGLINIARMTKDKDELNEILGMIEGRVNTQDHFIREIIDYSRNARTETVLEPINLYELIEDIVLSLKFHGDADRIAFRNLVQKDRMVTSDRIRLRVILGNLIGNAIKYHDMDKKEPFIETGIDEERQGIYVKDNGTGMSDEHQQRIFQMFYRGSDKSTGSGLGLFITREAVHKLGGEITVSSVPGQESIFLVRIPC